MLYPAVSELENKSNSRYALVIMTAKRARQISEQANAQEIDLPHKPVKMAIMDIAAGKVTVKAAEETETVEE